FERLVEELRPDRSLAQAAIFQVMLVLQNAPLPRFELPGLSLTVEPLGVGAAKFDLTLSLSQGPGGLAGVFEYDADLFDRGTLERWSGYLATLLAGAVAHPGLPLSELPLLAATERQVLLAGAAPGRPDVAPGVSEPTIVQPEEKDQEKDPALPTRLAAREEKVAGLRAALSEKKRALLDKLVESRRGTARPQATITSRGETGPAVLSFAQERLWFLDRLQPGSSLYNVPTVLRLAGRLDLPALARCLGEIVRRHEALRTTFDTVGGEPRQVIWPARPVPVPVIDLSGVPAARREPEARRLAVSESLRPFDLTSGPLLRTTFLRLAEAEGLALFNLHHIVGDGWSTGLLVGEIAILYRACAAGGEPPLPELPIQYADFATWQRGWLAGEVLAGELAHWRRELDGAPDLLELPTDRPRPPVQSFHGDDLRLTLPRWLAARLSAFAEREGATLFMVLLAGFQALLGRWSGQEDLLVGSAVANRTHRETEGLIGFFVNLLVLRGRLAGEPSCRELLARARTTALAAYAHQELPFEKLVEELRLARSLAHNPLVQAVLVLQNAPRGALELPGLTLHSFELPGATAKFDLGLTVTEIAGELLCQLEYATDLFDRTTVARLAGGFERLLQGFVDHPETPFSDISLLSAAEHQQAVHEWSGESRE
ncbi:MAG TPA: condensation domain-containing protein, partial [Thermoanaerobaculia bacterium]|nr:condensation domain-containing protein [Thermoanaerobaculia bacterium]